MAIVDKKGILHGAVSNIVYRSYRGLQIAQMKPVEVRQTVGSKEAGLEFGLASSTAFTIRRAFSSIFKGHDGGMVNRLNATVRKSIAGSDKERGERDIHDADLSILKGFQFNANSRLDEVLAPRPSAELTADNQIKISLPAIAKYGIKSPVCDAYTIRFVAVAFDYRKEVYSYCSHREIKLSSTCVFAGGEIIMDEPFPPGRLLLLSMSIHAYKDNRFDGMQSINSKDWSPAEIIGAWQLPENMVQGPKVTVDKPKKNVPLPYHGNELLSKIQELRQKYAPKNAEPYGPESRLREKGFKLPEGDIPIKRE